MWIDWFRSGWQTANYSCFYIYRFYFALVSVFLFPCVYIPLFSLPFQRFQTKTHMLRCFCPQKQEINQTLCMCNEANLRFFWATICVRLWVCVCLCVVLQKAARHSFVVSRTNYFPMWNIPVLSLWRWVCVCCHSTAKNQLALRSFFALFPFLIFVLVVGNGEIGIPFSVLRNDSLLCITSVKYINKPRCNWIICLHIHRDNCNGKERNAIWKCSSSAPHNHNQVHMQAILFFFTRSDSMHVKIFDMSLSYAIAWRWTVCSFIEPPYYRYSIIISAGKWYIQPNRFPYANNKNVIFFCLDLDHCFIFHLWL